MIKASQNYMNLKQLAEYLGVSYAYVKREWAGWAVRLDIKIAEFPGRMKRISRRDADRIFEAYRITT